jgi:hypothetical protein
MVVCSDHFEIKMQRERRLANTDFDLDECPTRSLLTINVARIGVCVYQSSRSLVHIIFVSIILSRSLSFNPTRCQLCDGAIGYRGYRGQR